MIVNLNTKCKIEKKVITQDANYGTHVTTWTKLANVWCEKQDILPSRSEAVAGEVIISTDKSRIRMRFRDDVDSSMRFTINSQVYQIVSGPAEIGRRQHIEFVVEKYSS